MEVTFQHVCDPCEYLLFDNVCTLENLNRCFSEAKLIEPAFEEPSKTGSAKTKNGKLKKQNNGIFLSKIYTPDFALHSPISSSLDSIFKMARGRRYTALSQMNYLKNIVGYNVLLSAYKNEDYYESHQDTSVLTILFWFGDSGNKGGDLLFTDFDHTVPFASNRALVFPSYYEHEVTKIETDKQGYVRYSASAFLCIDGMSIPDQPVTVGTNDF